MVAAWVEAPWLALDVESTGVGRWRDLVVEVATALVEPDGTVGETFCTIVDPGVEIPAEAAAIHGITTDRARAEGVPTCDAIAEVARRMIEHGFRPSVLFNAGFDIPMLAAEAERHRIEFPVYAPVLDPFLVDKMVDPYRPGSRKLVDVAAHYGVDLSAEDAHGALADCIAAARVMRRIVEEHPEIARHTLGSVYIRQVRGHERWRESFVDYKRINQDPMFYASPGWPIPSDGVPVKLEVLQGSGEAASRASADDAAGAAPSPDTSPGVAGEGPAAAGGSTGEVAADARQADAATEPVLVTLSVETVGKFGTKVLRPLDDGSPGVTDRVKRLRHAVAFAAVQKRSLNDCEGRELHEVYQRLVDIRDGRMLVEPDDDGVWLVMVKADGEPDNRVYVPWSAIEEQAVA